MWRNFSGETEALAARWAAMVTTNDHWDVGTAVAGTQTQPHHVQCGHVVGVGKPIAVLNDGKHRAAHEKIASNLGYRLGLPVLPVVLWDRTGIDGAEPYACVVAWAFKPVYPLGVGVKHLTDDERLAIGPAMSALIPFDYWLADTDRKHDHVVITSARGAAPPALGSIDYSNSMSFQWDCDDHASTGSNWHQNGWQNLAIPFDPAAFDQSLTLIENFDINQITEIVSAIPPTFLPLDKQAIIIQNLSGRRRRLRQMINI